MLMLLIPLSMCCLGIFDTLWHCRILTRICMILCLLSCLLHILNFLFEHIVCIVCSLDMKLSSHLVYTSWLGIVRTLRILLMADMSLLHSQSMLLLSHFHMYLLGKVGMLCLHPPQNKSLLHSKYWLRSLYTLQKFGLGMVLA